GTSSGTNHRTEQHWPDELLEVAAYSSQVPPDQAILSSSSGHSSRRRRSTTTTAGKASKRGRLCPRKPRLPSKSAAAYTRKCKTSGCLQEPVRLSALKVQPGNAKYSGMALAGLSVPPTRKLTTWCRTSHGIA